MYTVDYRRHLKLLEERGVGGHLLDAEYTIPLERLPKKQAPYHCQSVRVFALRDRPSEKHTEDYFFKTVTLPPDHPMFTSGESLISPISKAIGIPLIVYLEAPLVHPLMRPEHPEYANPVVKSLLTKLRTGDPSFRYYAGLGTALVARIDHQPLSTGLLTTIHAYVRMLVNERYEPNGDGMRYIRVQYTVTPSDFAEFSRKFVDKTKKDFRKEWDFKF